MSRLKELRGYVGNELNRMDDADKRMTCQSPSKKKSGHVLISYAPSLDFRAS